jgi:4-hydroxybenzoate polyprenyltransferase
VSIADVLFGYAAPVQHSLRNDIIGFITLQRVGVIIVSLPTVAASWALAGGQFYDYRFLFLLIVAWLIIATSHIINDLIDTERDKKKWPLRPISSGLISKSTATLYAAILTGIGLLMAGLIFNWLFAAMTFLCWAGNYIYTRYTRDGIGYLTVALPIALIPVAVWTAISPQTVFTPLPWLLFTIWGVAAVAEIITNEASNQVEAKALFVQFRPRTEMVIYFICVITVFFSGIVLFFYAKFSWLFIILLIVLTAWALTAVRYLGEYRSPETLKKAFMTFTIVAATLTLSITIFAWIK